MAICFQQIFLNLQLFLLKEKKLNNDEIYLKMMKTTSSGDGNRRQRAETRSKAR